MIITIAAEKGGVGKTTTAVHLASGLAPDRRVLLVDLDSQGHSTHYLGNQERSGTMLYEALIEEGDLTPIETPFGVDLIPGGRALAALKTELPTRHDAVTALRDALRPLKGLYDVIILDGPPELGIITLNAMLASDALLIPVQCQAAALLGMEDVLATLEEVRSELHHPIYLLGVVPTMRHASARLSQDVMEHLETSFGEDLAPSIRISTALAESFGHATPIYTHASRDGAADDYRELCRWITQRI